MKLKGGNWKVKVLDEIQKSKWDVNVRNLVKNPSEALFKIKITGAIQYFIPF